MCVCLSTAIWESKCSWEQTKYHSASKFFKWYFFKLYKKKKGTCWFTEKLSLHIPAGNITALTHQRVKWSTFLFLHIIVCKRATMGISFHIHHKTVLINITTNAHWRFGWCSMNNYSEHTFSDRHLCSINAAPLEWSTALSHQQHAGAQRGCCKAGSSACCMCPPLPPGASEI